MSDAVPLAIFFGCGLLLAHAYVVFPATMLWLGSRRALPDREPPQATGDMPQVAVVVAAFNEEAHIAERIRNLLEQDYPRDRLRVLVGSDGSGDRTVAEALRLADERVEVSDFPVNRGKASVLNDLVAHARAEVIVFTDANTEFAPDAVRRLVAALDADTAAVCGELVLQRARRGDNEDHRYWSMERRLKSAESRFGALLGANGGVYAIRKDAFRPILPDTICDDFVIAMNVATAGKGLRYVPSAVAFEETHGDMVTEYHRRVRIGIGNYQALFRHPRYLLAGSWMRRYAYVSHKVLRWFTPQLLLAVLVASLLLSHHPIFAALAVLQVAGYAFAVAAFTLRGRVAWPGPVNGALLFAVLNVAFLVAFKRFLWGDFRGSWRRTERGA